MLRSRHVERTVGTFEKAADGLSGGAALEVMGHAYVELICDPTKLNSCQPRRGEHCGP